MQQNPKLLTLDEIQQAMVSGNLYAFSVKQPRGLNDTLPHLALWETARANVRLACEPIDDGVAADAPTDPLQRIAPCQVLP